jgi:ArsR family transcriptional regulator, arsenate/arsenite/antimonite-responsive transcriptional repressor
MDVSTTVLLDETEVVRALAALAQPVRLRIFRALAVAGPDGMTPGLLSDLLELAPSGLSFHLKELTHAGLADAEQRGRNVVYRARFERMLSLMGYLTEHCCQGASCGIDALKGCAR